MGSINCNSTRKGLLTMREIMGYDKHPELRARAKAKAEAYHRRKESHQSTPRDMAFLRTV